MLFEEITKTEMLKICRWAKKNKKHGAYVEVEEVPWGRWNVKTSLPNLITDSSGKIHQYSKKEMINGVWYFTLMKK